MSDMIEIDVNTGDLVERVYTQEELDYRDYLESQITLPEQIVDPLAELRQSALNKFVRMGLTEEEARAIVGI